MLQKIKNFLKRFLPASSETFIWEIERVLHEIDCSEQKYERVLQKQSSEFEGALQKQSEEILLRQSELAEQIKEVLEQQKMLLESQKNFAEQQKEMAEIQGELIKQLQTIRSENGAAKELLLEQQQLEKHREELWTNTKATQERLIQTTTKTLRTAEEAVWAAIFRDTAGQSEWLKDQTFSAGRWAIGYQALYVMYRVLNEARPKRILELGLGQSTRMIAQYAAAFEDVEHIVVEQDVQWIEFFKNDFSLSEHTEILQLDYEMSRYQDAEAVRTFKNFEKALEAKQFDFIFIDAPLGGDMKQFARIDVLKCMPDCLADSFVIMLDDCERVGEKRTIEAMENVLKENGIEFKRSFYSGIKTTGIWVTSDKKYLSSL